MTAGRQHQPAAPRDDQRDPSLRQRAAQVLELAQGIFEDCSGLDNLLGPVSSLAGELDLIADEHVVAAAKAQDEPSRVRALGAAAAAGDAADRLRRRIEVVLGWQRREPLEQQERSDHDLLCDAAERLRNAARYPIALESLWHTLEAVADSVEAVAKRHHQLSSDLGHEP